MPDLVTSTSKDFYLPDGTKVAPSVWASCAKEVIGYDTVELNKEPIEIFTRFSGIDHGSGNIWELGVTGNQKNTEHMKFHGRHELFKLRDDAIAAHAVCLKAVQDAAKVVDDGR